MTVYVHRAVIFRAWNTGIERARDAYAGEGLAVEEDPLCVACLEQPPAPRKRKCNPCIYQRRKKAAA